MSFSIHSRNSRKVLYSIVFLVDAQLKMITFHFFVSCYALQRKRQPTIANLVTGIYINMLKIALQVKLIVLFDCFL